MNNQEFEEYLKELGRDIMIELDDEEIKNISLVQTELLANFAKVTKIDTNEIEPMYYPIETANTYLRDDQEIETNDQRDILANAPKVDRDYITIVKVVK